MTHLGHRLTGIITAMALYAAHPSIGIFSVIACVAGATAPDWLEIPRKNKLTGERASIIPHRTITHWLPAWLIGIVLSMIFINTFLGKVAFGFTLGGLVHLAFDIPNPMGIPILNLNKNTSLNLWPSGKNEWLIIPVYAASLALIVGLVHLVKGCYLE